MQNEKDDGTVRPPLWARLSDWLHLRADRAEIMHLSLLRWVVLAGATAALCIAAIALLWGSVQAIGDPDTIAPAPVALAESDLIPATAVPATATAPANNDTRPRWQREVPPATVREYTSLFHSAFAPYYRVGEARPNQQQLMGQLFDDRTLDAVATIAPQDIVGLSADANVLSHMISLLREASAAPPVQRQLTAYRDARRAQVCEDVTRSRPRRVAQWDSASTSCELWYEPPYGCQVTRTVSEPYTARECAMRFPGEIPDPALQLRQLQERYLATLSAKRIDAEALAGERRVALLERQQEGRQVRGYAVWSFLIFLGLMFMYLVIAMERHQRRQSTLLAPLQSDDGLPRSRTAR